MSEAPELDRTQRELLDRATRAERALEEVTAERNRLWAELNRNAAMNHEVEHYRRLVTQMESSRSWRLTAPLRAVVEWARDLRALARKAARFLADRRSAR